MAFHVACPITCRRICYCSLGFHSNLSKNHFLQEVDRIEEFLKDPWGIRVLREATVQVSVPRVAPVIVPPPPPPAVLVVADGDAVEEAAAVSLVSTQAKRVALQKKAAAAMVAAEDFARKFESGDNAVAKDSAGEEQVQGNNNIMCRLCFVGENEGSERARRMLSCKSCGKKYHRSCLKTWSQNRDLFHWSSWTCPSCRMCEICRRTGDPNKFMFCRRCDGAYHCYCQHPPHKNVSSGPYLCPKHTRCHSCGSTVPGNGLSVRWFLGYTCCDACGRLFVKGNYCPVCLKVYRDSESTPMVCCDVCQRWVHCHCDGISDEKYMQFQVDGNLQYKCATCRGECYQVKDLEDAVQELWRRRDKADQDLIASLRAVAGLPTQEEIFSISPFSDDEDNGPAIRNDFGRSLKLSLKGVVDKSPKKTKEYGKKFPNKKYVKKKGNQSSLISETEQRQSFEGHHDDQCHKYGLDDKNDDLQPHRNEGSDNSSPVAGIVNPTEGVCYVNQPGVLKHKFVDEVMVSDEDRRTRVVKIKSTKYHDLDSGDDTGNHASKSKTVKAKKLVINLGARKINVSNSPRSEASSFQRENDLMTSNGIEDTSRQRTSDKSMLGRQDVTAKIGDGDSVDHSGQSKGLKFAGKGHHIKFGKVRSDVSDSNPNLGRGSSADETVHPEQTRFSSVKRSIEGSRAAVGPVDKIPTIRGDKANNDDYVHAPDSHSVPKESKPLLKFKLKKPNPDNQNFQVPRHEEEKSIINRHIEQESSMMHPEEEKSSVKGQRSKRKRPSLLMEKTSYNEDEDLGISQSHQDSLMDEIMDANWILKKLGKDAIGKRVEVHQPSENSWHKGVVTDNIGGTSTLSVTLDDGRVKTLELGKQGVRFVPQKQKRSRT
ncbi:hypothetical protein CFOL_v3_29500 [Cephalotus follicularis]|uniref:PHD domain-containing protein n=1 Tax=Cephalotus follicularis TaxID=3775 RepID=A0A1Q3D0P4_CEPFO|nr:hypothetical protein CFOL_v3_29500 [Cephalotus follicularis]